MTDLHVILIEDNPSDAMIVRMALDDLSVPYTLTQFESGADAVRALCQTTLSIPAPDAILFDLSTPRTDGFEALAQLKSAPLLADVPITIITSSAQRTHKNRAAVLGARYIEKPMVLRDFLASVNAALREMAPSRFIEPPPSEKPWPSALPKP